MDAGLVRQFWMESRGKKAPGAHQGGKAVAGREDFHIRTSPGNPGSPDEDHLEGPAREGGLGLENRRIDLTSICIPLDSDIERSQGLLCRMLNVLGKQDSPGAGAKGWNLCNERLKNVKEVIPFEELQHRGRFAARHNEARHGWCAVGQDEVARHSNEFRSRPKNAKGLGMGFKSPLQGEYANCKWSGHHPILLHVGSEP